ncbi:uncharacterized protein LOC128441940 [Pleuronectes platessa]|uniref:uncharacterized protein LOC128441940 n=1 Tax=Pleuronectes platessa TaxID=8262 RepID=UPI00232A67A8|nr:uncharacterized protein LOC128441940 [Pleuronectes platessa]
MAAHALLLCSLALLSALSRPGLSFSEDEELQPGLIYEEVPEILERRGFDGATVVHREAECSGSALYGNRGQTDLFTSLWSRHHTFPLLSSTQHRHRRGVISIHPSVGASEDVHRKIIDGNASIERQSILGGLPFDKPIITGYCVEINKSAQMIAEDRMGQRTQSQQWLDHHNKENRPCQDGGYGLESEEFVLSPEDENPLRRILQPFNWHQNGMSTSKRKLLQSLMGPYGPLSVSYNGKTCILFKAKRLAIRYRNHTFIDLTERVFNTNAPVDTKGSICTKEKATLSLRFGDVEDLRGLVIRLQMSNTFYEAAGQNWFTLDSVHIHYNWTQEATFNASEVYAPATSSYHCQHVSSLHKYDTLLVPSSHTDTSANWHITFTDFQIQAFNVLSDKFASASDCATFLTPAILMGLVTSLILLLVLAYALHMVVHLKHIDRYEEHKATVYFPRSPEAELPDKNSL